MLRPCPYTTAIIRDQGSKIREGIDKQYFRVAYLQRQMAGGIEGDGHEFGLRPADLHPHKPAEPGSIPLRNWNLLPIPIPIPELELNWNCHHWN